VLVVKVNVFKAPVTDLGKTSKKGRLKLVKDDEGRFHTQEEIPASSYKPDDPKVSCVNLQTSLLITTDTTAAAATIGAGAIKPAGSGAAPPKFLTAGA